MPTFILALHIAQSVKDNKAVMVVASPELAGARIAVWAILKTSYLSTNLPMDGKK